MGKGGHLPSLENQKVLPRKKNSIDEVSLNGRDTAFP